MEPDPGNISFLFDFIFLLQISWSSFVGSIVALLLLLIASALISGSEVAFFAITPKVFHDLEDENKLSSKRIVALLKESQKLLATILIANNFINIGIVILSDYLLSNTLPEDTFTNWSKAIARVLGEESFSISSINDAIIFLITVIGVTFILVLFGEVMPKVYARINTLKIARITAGPLSFLVRFFAPISKFLVSWTNKIEKRLEDKAIIGKETSSDEITEAIDLMSSNERAGEAETDLLKKIVRFGNVNISQIMKPRTDVVGLDASLNYKEVLEVVRACEYSRLPVFEETLDSITGILHVKKFMKCLHEKENFNWNQEGIVQQEVMFEPETKKISEILRGFQEERKHMAIVVDEYGGTSGIITLEDVLEEILGDIYDEFDSSSAEDFKRVNEHTFIFEGKTFLNDVVKILKLPEDFFDKIKGDADTIAGVVLENLGKMPSKNYKFTYEGLTFKVKDVDKRRINKVQITLLKEK